jgi:hypothetical protein
MSAFPDQGGPLSAPGYPADFPRPGDSAAVQGDQEEYQSLLQHGIAGVGQERYGQAELH